jgi:hypothetical protein
VAEIELGRGTTPLPAGLEAEGHSEQRCVVKLDDVGYHIVALVSLTLPSWQATFTWQTVQHLEVEPTAAGVAITIARPEPGELPGGAGQPLGAAGRGGAGAVRHGG